MLTIILIFIGGFLFVLLAYTIVNRILRRLFNYSPPVSANQSSLLESRLRMIIQPPDTIIGRSGVLKDMHLLDIGCGSGPYTIPLARSVGVKGKVYALDIQQEMLDKLKEKLRLPHNDQINNIHPLLADASKIPLQDSSLDMVVIISVTREFSNAIKVFEEIKRTLKPCGLLAISEILIDMDYISRSKMIKLGTRAGLTVAEIEGNLWSYTIIFRKSQA